MMQTLTVSEARANLYRLMDQAALAHEPITILGKRSKAQELLAVVRENPFQNPQPYEKLVGDLQGAYSRRINIQHRLAYQILMDEDIKTVKVLRRWSHYE